MRPAQMGRLTPDDFRLEAEIPHVRIPPAKGGRTAAVPLLEEGIAVAHEYIALDAFGKWSTASANKELSKAAKAAGQDPFTTYQIRHSCTAGLRQTGADVADIEDLYGHTNAETTKIYAPAAMKKHKAAIKRLRDAGRRPSVEAASK